MIKIPKLHMLLRSGYEIATHEPRKNRFTLYPIVPDHPSEVAYIDFYPRSQIHYFDKNMQWHNSLGPSMINQYGYEFRKHGFHHRYNGPARVSGNAAYNREMWYLHGERINGEEYKEWLDTMGINMLFITDEDKILIDLKWGS